MSGSKSKSGRELADEIKRKAAARQRRDSMLIFGGIALVVLVLVALTVKGLRNASDEASPQNVDLKKVSGLGRAAAPPWSLPADVPARVKAAGLDLGMMGTADHYHAHLDVIADGKPVQVLEGIGLDPANGAMSGLHTHSADGVIHVEASAKGQPFTLGQLFTQWNVRLTPDQIGSMRAGSGKSLKAFVNGKEVKGNPAMIRLAARQQIALMFGSEDSPVKPPASFDFGGS